jgi:hypothetical protein
MGEVTCPMMTSETSSGFIEARLRASWITIVPNSLPRNDESFPQKDPKTNFFPLH